MLWVFEGDLDVVFGSDTQMVVDCDTGVDVMETT